MKKIINKILILFLMFFTINIFNIEKVYAATSKTADQAIEWVESMSDNKIGDRTMCSFNYSLLQLFRTDYAIIYESKRISQ